jgi:hypothetical protein
MKVTTHITHHVWWEELCIHSLFAVMANCVFVEDKVEFCFVFYADEGHVVVQLVEALHYKSEDCRFDSQWCCWNFSLT